MKGARGVGGKLRSMHKTEQRMKSANESVINYAVFCAAE